ncbi:hypothetical protein PR048_004380 [Dryococelus australis]|uniref:Maturase n=1 Tax=Dryococelus australis TaxID=614101 RepID=A0ABQ9I5A9_9NEOP|nr:hypothetical protein PR048_004380 [Dryococelus australis]
MSHRSQSSEHTAYLDDAFDKLLPSFMSLREAGWTFRLIARPLNPVLPTLLVSVGRCGDSRVHKPIDKARVDRGGSPAGMVVSSYDRLRLAERDLSSRRQYDSLRKRKIPDKTRRPAASSGAIPVSTTAAMATRQPCSSRDACVLRLLASHRGESGSIPGGDTPGLSHVGESRRTIAAGRRVLSGILRFSPSPFTPTLLRIHLAFALAVSQGLDVEEQATYLHSLAVGTAGLDARYALQGWLRAGSGGCRIYTVSCTAPGGGGVRVQTPHYHGKRRRLRERACFLGVKGVWFGREGEDSALYELVLVEVEGEPRGNRPQSSRLTPLTSLLRCLKLLANPSSAKRASLGRPPIRLLICALRRCNFLDSLESFACKSLGEEYAWKYNFKVNFRSNREWTELRRALPRLRLHGLGLFNGPETRNGITPDVDRLLSLVSPSVAKGQGDPLCWNARCDPPHWNRLRVCRCLTVWPSRGRNLTLPQINTRGRKWSLITRRGAVEASCSCRDFEDGEARLITPARGGRAFVGEWLHLAMLITRPGGCRNLEKWSLSAPLGAILSPSARAASAEYKKNIHSLKEFSRPSVCQSSVCFFVRQLKATHNNPSYVDPSVRQNFSWSTREARITKLFVRNTALLHVLYSICSDEDELWFDSRQAVSPLASHQGEPGSISGRITPGFSQVGIVPDDATGRWGFSGISLSPSPELLHSRLISLTSALKTSLLRVLCTETFSVKLFARKRLSRTEQRHDGNTARHARRSDEALGVRVSVARIAPSLLDLGRAASPLKSRPNLSPLSTNERTFGYICRGHAREVSSCMREQAWAAAVVPAIDLRCSRPLIRLLRVDPNIDLPQKNTTVKIT